MDHARRPLDVLVDELLPTLTRMAERYMMRERPDHTFQSGGTLVSEAYIRVRESGRGPMTEDDFLGLMSASMRRILIEHARGRRALKRGARWTRVGLDQELVETGDEREHCFDLDDALAALGRRHPHLARLVELRVVGGLSPARTAATLGISTRQAARRWDRALAWLRRRLGAGSDDAAAPHAPAPSRGAGAYPRPSSSTKRSTSSVYERRPSSLPSPSTST